jgi:hypothetical protein
MNIEKDLVKFEISKPLVALFLLISFLFLINFPVFKYLDNFLSYLDKHSSGFTTLVAICALVFGSAWIDTSKKKMKGKLSYDIARKYLKVVLKVRDAIKVVRAPFISAGEIQYALKEQGLDPDKFEKENSNRAVYSLRFNKIQDAWTELEAVLLDAEVSWGHEAIKKQENLDLLIRKLRSTVWLFVNYPENFQKNWDNNNKILYGTYDDSDEFSESIDKEIEKIRDFLAQYL